MNKTSKKIVVGIIVLAILCLLVLLAKPRKIEAITENTQYDKGSDLNVVVQNNFGQTLCFSSCYPYFLQKKTDDDWTKYDYGECQNTDTAAFCISSHKFKKFQLPLENVETGMHRLMIPICTTCQEGQPFHQDQVIYSNEFIVR